MWIKYFLKTLFKVFDSIEWLTFFKIPIAQNLNEISLSLWSYEPTSPNVNSATAMRSIRKNCGFSRETYLFHLADEK